ncbi:MAG: succinoglycan biosynthesis protein exoa [Limisphaera sp.]|nr:MAG: succinoglycan biosynthesis protein exoa [Limisphaera sp.]
MARLVSVIMPVWNEADSIEAAVRSVLNQEWPGEALEVCVVDGGSTDGTRAILARLTREDPRVRVLPNPRRIIPVALNLGLRAARGDWLARLDGHGTWPPDYLRECTAYLQRQNGLVMVGGAWDCVGEGWLGAAMARAVGSPWGVGNARYRTVSPGAPAQLVDSVPFWVTRRETFERVGLFHEGYRCHEDYEFNYRLRRAGGRVWLLPWVRAQYRVRPTLGRLARQYFRYGHWKGRFLVQAPRSLQLRHCVPPLWMAMNAGLAAAAVADARQIPVAAGWVGLYAAWLLVATVGLSRRPRPPEWDVRSALVLPWILSVVHATWGTGVWTGLLRGRVSGEPAPWPKGEVQRAPGTTRELPAEGLWSD